MGLFYHKKQAGFTLLELVVVVAIVGILAAMSMPLYTNYIRRGYRADAQAALMEASVRMQRFFTVNNSFDGADANAAAIDNIFGGSTVIPPNSPNPMYNLGLVADVGTYTLTATPVAGTEQESDECDILTVLSSGAKNAAINTCWQ